MALCPVKWLNCTTSSDCQSSTCSQLLYDYYSLNVVAKNLDFDAEKSW